VSGFLLGIPSLTGHCVHLFITGVHSLTVSPGVCVFVCLCACVGQSSRSAWYSARPGRCLVAPS